MEVIATAGTISVITGGIGSGKTTFCQKLADSRLANGQPVQGFISPARLENGTKTGILARNLRDGSSRVLASIYPEEHTGFQYGPWYFNAATIQWVNSLLDSCSPTDLLILDEIGPIEFDYKGGFARAFTTLKRVSFREAVIVIRPAYVSVFKDRGFQFQVFDLDTRQMELFSYFHLD